MKTGDKVVCVDDSPCRLCGAPVNLKKGQVYVIMEIEDVSGLYGREPALKLIGTPATCLEHNPFNAHRASRFRLLDELKQENQLKSERKTLMETLGIKC